jgi:hypothetical protein
MLERPALAPQEQKRGDGGQLVSSGQAATSDKVADAWEPGCSLGLKAPVDVTVSTAGRCAMITGNDWRGRMGFSSEESHSL